MNKAKSSLRRILADLGDLHEYFRDAHPADIAALMSRVDEDAALALFLSADADQQAEILPELGESLRDHILEEMTREDLVPVLNEMESDDAADLVQELQELDEQRAEDVLAGLDHDLRADLVQLLGHGDDTAGGVMAREFVSALAETTVDQAIGLVRRLAEDREVEDIYVVFVVDGEGRLLGQVSLQRLLLARRGQRMGEIMDREVISARADADQEEVAALARKYDLASVPIVDSEGRLLGRVTMDDVYDIAHEEAGEDIARLAGTVEDVLERSSLVVIRQRTPWLLVGLAGGLVNALVMSRFEADLRALLSASFFVPVVMGMGGNVANQSATIVVRGLATGELEVKDLLPRLWKESKVGFALGLACSLVMLTVVWLWLGSPATAGVIALAMACVIMQATVVGAFVPLLLKWAGIDPALASGPFLSTSNDILGLSVYLLLISAMLT
ncbi:MAG: magnesium transporter [bacterium]|nr:magnesium transporter [bacterium]